ncbi:spectinomycin phosphotransferase [Actinoplanes octamycinicus]|uniref:Spectinomycin phosphotransferase n=1 Tax=Actinoplanes octamycinicus TaxID=135948 RepID=A0A7W7H4G6_9ACTN|nr:spectinomycin phosphotransferase [Actinoplanes octamycinicus]
MREKPAGLAESDLVTALRSGWGIETVTIDYLPVGAGSYHWSVTEPSGRSWFVKVDRDDPDLRRSLATALALHRAGLDFVVAPVPALDGEVSHTLPHDSTSAAPQSLPRDSTDAASQSLPHDSTGTASRSLPHDSTGAATQSLPRDSTGAPSHSLRHDYTVAVFPLLDGAAGHFGPHPLADISEMSEMLGALHRTTPAVATLAPRTDLRLIGRTDLETALGDLDHPWTSGPHAEPARALLRHHATRVHDWLTEFDHLAGVVRDTAADWVVTHGEPHPGNVLRTPSGLRLIDWTTVQIAPPERDFWMLTDMFGTTPTGAGRSPATAFYRLGWILADVAAYTTDLRTPHQDDADSAAALTYLAANLDS